MQSTASAECHCNKCISTISLTFCKAQHAIATKPTNNVTFREIGAKDIREFGRSHCMNARKIERVIPTRRIYCFWIYLLYSVLCCRMDSWCCGGLVISLTFAYHYIRAWASAEIFPGEGSVDIFPIPFRLLTMQCKWTFTKRFYPFNTTKKRPQESTCPIRILFDLVLRCSCIQCIGLPDDRYFTDLAGILLLI